MKCAARSVGKGGKGGFPVQKPHYPKTSRFFCLNRAVLSIRDACLMRIARCCSWGSTAAPWELYLAQAVERTLCAIPYAPSQIRKNRDIKPK